MVSAKICVHIPHGFHLRPAGQLAEFAGKYKCKITLCHGSKKVNGTSLLGILGLCTKQGSEITVQCDGEDEIVALNEMIDYIDNLR